MLKIEMPLKKAGHDFFRFPLGAKSRPVQRPRERELTRWSSTHVVVWPYSPMLRAPLEEGEQGRPLFEPTNPHIINTQSFHCGKRVALNFDPNCAKPIPHILRVDLVIPQITTLELVVMPNRAKMSSRWAHEEWRPVAPGECSQYEATGPGALRLHAESTPEEIIAFYTRTLAPVIYVGTVLYRVEDTVIEEHDGKHRYPSRVVYRFAHRTGARESPQIYGLGLPPS